MLQIPCEKVFRQCLGTQNPLQKYLQKGLEHKGEIKFNNLQNWMSILRRQTYLPCHCVIIFPRNLPIPEETKLFYGYKSKKTPTYSTLEHTPDPQPHAYVSEILSSIYSE